MATLQHVGVAAPGMVTTRSDEAPALAGAEGFKGNRTAGSGDCAAKLIATATARAALLGIEVHQIDGGAWLLRHARGGSVGTVQGLPALDAAIVGFEATQHDVRELVQGMRGTA